MITSNLPVLGDKTVILVPDDGALLAMAEHGADALDWLFLPGAEVVVTDMVRNELLRDRPTGEEDYHPKQRSLLAHWFSANGQRLTILVSEAGEEYAADMAAWERAGHPAGLMPELDWSDGARLSHVLQTLSLLRVSPGKAPHGRKILVVANHSNTRSLVHTKVSDDLALTGTLRFFGMVAGEYRIDKAVSIVARDFAA